MKFHESRSLAKEIISEVQDGGFGTLVMPYRASTNIFRILTGDLSSSVIKGLKGCYRVRSKLTSPPRCLNRKPTQGLPIRTPTPPGSDRMGPRCFAKKKYPPPVEGDFSCISRVNAFAKPSVE